jgi:hypothetical protein
MPICYCVGPGPRSVSVWVNAPNRLTPQRYIISGVTRNSTGTPLETCVVNVFDTVSNTLLATTISDAGGNYSLGVNGLPGLTFYAVAYKAGGTDVEGTTVNTLVSTPN